MHWLALLPPREDEALAWGWHALQFTPRVARLDEAWVLEVSGSERLFGGRRALLRRLLGELGLEGSGSSPLWGEAGRGARGSGEGEPVGAQNPHPDPLPEGEGEGANRAPLPLPSGERAGVRGGAPTLHWAQASSSLVALALLRLKVRGLAPPPRIPHDLPLSLLSVAVPHVSLLERTGCRTWGQLRALPRGPVARRFGAALLEALDVAWGERPERHAWLQWPEVFDQRLELPALATQASELMWTAQRLLSQLQLWLRGRHLGVLALELEWTLDLKRLDGVALPPHQQLVVRTAQPVQEMAHLRRLVGEQLARARLAAPANHLRLRSLETAPWAGASRSFLPEDNVEGERLHQLVERLSARLGEDQVLVPRLQADWRPERMQCWEPAVRNLDAVRAEPVEALATPALYPPWLLPEPLRLPVRDHRPWYEGPLRLLTRRQRIETGWWEEGGAVVRDYCIARSERAGLLWVFCEHHLPDAPAWPPQPARWYLQGLYA